MTLATGAETVTVPADLIAHRQWVGWRRQVRGGKQTKPPYNARTGKLASTTDPKTWSTFEEARAVVSKYDGIGFVLTAHDPFVAFDLDHCRTPQTGEVTPQAKEIIESLDSYTEISPSGTGIRIFTKGTLPPGWRNRGGVEVYDRERYVTITGDHLPRTPRTIEERSEAIAALHARIFGGTERVPAGNPCPTEGVPQRWLDMIARGYKPAVDHWEGRAGGHPDQSGSAKDLKLAWFCRKHGFGQEETAAIIAQAPYAVGGGRSADYVARTIEKAFAGKGTRRAQRTEPYGAVRAQVVTSGAWANLSPKAKAVYIPLVVRRMRPSGIARVGLVTLAAEAGVSVSKVKAATAELAKAGLIRKARTPVGTNYWVPGPEDPPEPPTYGSKREPQVSTSTGPESAASQTPTYGSEKEPKVSFPDGQRPQQTQKRAVGQETRWLQKRAIGASGHEIGRGTLSPTPSGIPSGGGEAVKGHRGPDIPPETTAQPSQRHIWEILPTGERVVYQRQRDGSLLEVGRTLPDPEAKP